MVEDKDKRESGKPGGGAGRRDEVGRSGVYPMSGPHPPGPAEVRTEAAWGQGERGAAGYEDHGSSGLTWDRGELLGALDAESAGVRTPESEIDSQEIDRSEWLSFLNNFSREHYGWHVNVEIVSAGEKRLEVRNVPLEGVSTDHLNAPDERVYVEIGASPDQHRTHSIPAPRRVCYLRKQEGQHIGLDIEAADGSRTRVRFCAPAAPEMLDDVA